MRAFRWEVIHWGRLVYRGVDRWISPYGRAGAWVIELAARNPGIPNQYLRPAGLLSIHNLRMGAVYANEGHHPAVNQAA
jgi:hypothetical protein